MSVEYGTSRTNRNQNMNQPNMIKYKASTSRKQIVALPALCGYIKSNNITTVGKQKMSLMELCGFRQCHHQTV